jgi:hypothetical protein
MTKKRAPRHLADAKGAGSAGLDDRAYPNQKRDESKSPFADHVAQGDRIVEVLAGPGQRLIPAPIMHILSRQFPRLVCGTIENDNDVYLGIVDKKGRLEAWHYRASPEFLTACRVADSDPTGNNLAMLCGPKGLHMTLFPPRDEEGAS